MRVTPTDIPDVLILEPFVYGDARGFFFESFRQELFDRFAWPGAGTGTGADGAETSARGNARRLFVQDNQSRSARDVLRGLHYQIGKPQGKLIRVVTGEIFDVAVDIRRSSPTFGRWVGARLSAENKCQMWVPEGFAHGFLVMSELADVLYKATDYYAPECERTLAWNDPAIGIAWPLSATPVLAAKDAAGVLLREAELFA
ncbi:MAG: dTDP-4-dehydrorhamnose 3,5-epimerase [Acidobacteria bacterium]|nr:dTDP-4-dehydrorhamnose 3,5-epimerase [Acidobacteriota bacterium]